MAFEVQQRHLQSVRPRIPDGRPRPGQGGHRVDVAGRYGVSSARPAIPLTVLEWIQYQLDTAASVADVIASDARVRIQGQTPLHYLVGDRSGGTATIEFLMESSSPTRMRICRLPPSPTTRMRSPAHLWRRRGAEPAGGSGSLERFSRAALPMPAVASAGSTGSSQAAVDRAFAVLADVAQRSTRWSIVYEQSAGIVHWRTTGTSREDFSGWRM